MNKRIVVVTKNPSEIVAFLREKGFINDTDGFDVVDDVIDPNEVENRVVIGNISVFAAHLARKVGIVICNSPDSLDGATVEWFFVDSLVNGERFSPVKVVAIPESK